MRGLPSLSPMPLARRRESFDDPEWLFEIKLDGYRSLAYVSEGRAVFVSRNGHQFRGWESLAAELAASVRAGTAILDGEVVCLDRAGCPDFRALLFRRAEPYFYGFDLLWRDGEDLRRRPLLERKRILRRLMPRRAARVRYLDHVPHRGTALFEAVCDRDLEGVVAKWKRGVYAPAEPTSWIKIKFREYSQARDRHELFDGFRTGRRAGAR